MRRWYGVILQSIWSATLHARTHLFYILLLSVLHTETLARDSPSQHAWPPCSPPLSLTREPFLLSLSCQRRTRAAGPRRRLGGALSLLSGAVLDSSGNSLVRHSTYRSLVRTIICKFSGATVAIRGRLAHATRRNANTNVGNIPRLICPQQYDSRDYTGNAAKSIAAY